jgi:hypothetical protein
MLDGSPAIAALAAGRGTLSEHRPAIAEVLNLSALIGAKAGMVNDSLSTKERGRISDCPSPPKSKARGEKRYSPQIGESPLPLP